MTATAPAASTARRIMVGMSGGVDSSVSALLLKRQGFDIAGLFMKNWDEDDHTGLCTAVADVRDAAGVCERLDIELHTRNFAGEYWENVFEHFLAEYRAGRTPNPDVLCNREIKFKTFIEHAEDLGADTIATGHYARIRERDGRYQLLKGLDAAKDQSYFLYMLGQAALARARFPLGELRKSEVRALAREAGFDNAGKKDSTGICFIGERDFRGFLKRYLPAQPGPMQTPEGGTVGEHEGLMYYTLGQRQGLGIGGSRGGSGEPWYVVAKDLDNNVLIVAQGHDHPLLFSRRLTAAQLHWVADEAPATPLACAAKTRYRQPDQACEITRLDGDTCEVVFEQPQRAVTPGQSVVFYRDDVCLGGGIIETTEP